MWAFREESDLFPSQTRRLGFAFWRLPREPASTLTLPHIVRAARCRISHTSPQRVRWRSGRATNALVLFCLRCANWRFSQHCGHVVPGCSSDSRRRPRALWSQVCMRRTVARSGGLGDGVARAIVSMHRSDGGVRRVLPLGVHQLLVCRRSFRTRTRDSRGRLVIGTVGFCRLQ